MPDAVEDVPEAADPLPADVVVCLSEACETTMAAEDAATAAAASAAAADVPELAEGLSRSEDLLRTAQNCLNVESL